MYGVRQSLISMELIWLYKKILKNGHSVYELKRFFSRRAFHYYSHCYVVDNSTAYGFEIPFEKISDLLGDYTFKEKLKAFRDHILRKKVVCIPHCYLI
jgi:hypothetical protein